MSTETARDDGKAGLEDVVAARSAICAIDGEAGRLYYRGYEIAELAGRVPFEEVTALLWWGELPGPAGAAAFRDRLAAARELPGPVGELLERLPAGSHPLDALRTAGGRVLRPGETEAMARSLRRGTVTGGGWMVAAVLLLAGPVAWAADPAPPVRVAVFDFQQVALAVEPEASVRTDTGKPKAKARVAAPRPQPLKENPEAQRLRREILRRSAELDRLGPRLSAEERERREREIAKLRKDIMRIRSRALKAASKGGPSLEARVVDVVGEYAREKGIALLLDKGYWAQEDVQRAIVVPADTVDVTDEIVRWVKARGPQAAPTDAPAATGGTPRRGGGGGGGGGGGKGGQRGASQP